MCKKRGNTCKNVQKRASQVLIYQKNVQKHAKMCKIVQNRAKTCISNIFGPNSKTCTCEVRAAWVRVSRGLTVPKILEIPHNFFGQSTLVICWKNSLVFIRSLCPYQTWSIKTHQRWNKVREKKNFLQSKQKIASYEKFPPHITMRRRLK